jgi:hypothetical protein
MTWARGFGASCELNHDNVSSAPPGDPSSGQGLPGRSDVPMNPLTAWLGRTGASSDQTVRLVRWHSRSL